MIGQARYSAVVIAALLCASTAFATQCVVRTEAASLHVQALTDSGASIGVSVTDVPVSAVIPDAKNRPTRVHVDGPVSFDGTVSNLWVWITRPVETSDGSVQLRPGASLVHPRMHGSEVVADLVLDAGTYTPGEDKEPKEVVSPVQVPCDALQLAPPDDGDDEVPASSTAGSDPTWWSTVASDSHLRLFTEPTMSSGALDYRIFECDHCRINVQQIETRGSWMRVGRTEDFASFSGWVPGSKLKPNPNDGGQSSMWTGRPQEALCGPFTGFGSSHGKLVNREVHLKRGTRLRGVDGASKWGTVTSEAAIFKVRYLEGQELAVVDEMPKVRVDCASTLVPVAALLPVTEEPQ